MEIYQSEFWIFKSVNPFFNKRKTSIRSILEEETLRNTGSQLQSFHSWNAITVESKTPRSNRHNKSRHLSGIIPPFTFKLNRTRKNSNSDRFRGRRRRKIVDLWLPKNNFTLSPSGCLFNSRHHLSTDRLERACKTKEIESIVGSLSPFRATKWARTLAGPCNKTLTDVPSPVGTTAIAPEALMAFLSTTTISILG